MDDKRIEEALRAGPPDEPAYVPGLYRAIGAALDTSAAPAPADVAFEGRIRRQDGRVVTRARIGGLRFAASLAAVLAIIVAGLALRIGTEPAASPTPGDLLASVQAAGVIRVAVSDQAPQTAAAGGSYIGFDVDVAEAIAEQLGVRLDIEFLTPGQIFSTSGTWDVALPSHVVPDRPIAAVTAASYYDWPEWLVVAPESPATSIADLAGGTICVVDGSPAADWLAGTHVSYTDYPLDPPADTIVIVRGTDTACFDVVAGGDANAAVTATLLDLDVAGRGLRLLVADPVIVQHRVMVVRDAGPSADPSSLEAALEAAVSELRSSGRLAEMSRSAFGGRDLTEVVP